MTEARREKRREQILDCARAVFAEKGYHAATVEDIVHRVAVARGTFYLYFSDKRAVYETLVDRFFEAIDERVRRIDLDADETPVEQLRQNLLRITRLIEDEPGMLKIVLHDATGLDPDFDAKLRSFWERVSALIAKSLSDGRTMGMIRDGDLDVMAAMSLGALKEVLLRSVSSGTLRRSPEELCDQLLRFCANGVLTFTL